MRTEGKDEHARVARYTAFRSMLSDVERVRAALRTGAKPLQVQGRDWTTHRAPNEATIAHEPDGGVLELVKNGRVTRLGRLWDQERAKRARSRSPRVQEGK